VKLMTFTGESLSNGSTTRRRRVVWVFLVLAMIAFQPDAATNVSPASDVHAPARVDLRESLEAAACH
jgi:hypothetical protein